MLKLLIASVLFAQVAPLSELEIKVKVAIAIAQAKATTPFTPKPSDAVEWQSYAAAYKAHADNKRPLLVLLGAESCLPCKKLKEAIEDAKVGGINYAYVDVNKEPETSALFGFGETFIVPKAIFYSQSDRNLIEPMTPAEFIERLKSLSTPKLSTASKISQSATWSWRIERIPAPPGFGWVDIAGDAYYHVTGEHGAYIRAVTSKVDIRGMSRRDLLSLHSLIHSGLSVGRWEGRCFVFTLP